MLAVLLLATLAGPLAQAPPGSDQASPRVVGGAVKEPRKVRSVAPRYPEAANRAGLAGVVVLECVISPKGDVDSVKAIRGARVLSDAAIEAVRRWRYTPTLLDGVAVPVIMTVTVNFKMESVSYDGLMRSLRHEDADVRAAAARNLGGLRRSRLAGKVEMRDAIAALEPLATSDPSPQVRGAAAEALSILDDRPLAAEPTPLAPTQTGDTPPRVRKQARPAYPRKAFDARIEGTVLVEALVDAKGKVAKVRVVESVPGLDEAALEAVRKWRFDPATRDGRPVATIVHMPVQFRIY